MLVVLNGYPGVGKTTIGRVLAERLGARFLDVHTVYNVAFALTEFRTPPFYETVRAVAAVADARIRALPPGAPVVLTHVLMAGTEWSDEECARVAALGRDRAPFAMVHLTCDLEENRRRVSDPARLHLRKPRDPAMAERNHADARPLMDAGAPQVLRLDVTHLSPGAAAAEIEARLAG